MEIVVITGSAHKNGTSSFLAERFIDGATKAGHKVFRFDAAFKQIHGCIGCDTCRTKLKGCIFKDDMEEISPHLLFCRCYCICIANILLSNKCST